ncbi:MAG TPA: cytochrome c oxidase assembly protein [Ktedonobacterales bacterium]
MAGPPPPTTWNLDPALVIILITLLTAFALTTGPLRGRFPGSQPISRGQIALFVSGWTTLALSVLTPLDTLGRYYLFSAHTIQLFIIITLSTPLMMGGIPDWLSRVLLPSERSRAASGGLLFSVIAVLAFNGLILGWHIGLFYQAALDSGFWHNVQLLTFVAAGALTWWPLLTPANRHIRMSSPLQMLYLAAESIPLDIFGVFAIFARGVFYHGYAVAPRVFPISPALDQQISGGILAVPGNIIDVVLMSVIFFAWIERTERAQRERERAADEHSTTAGEATQ